MLRVLIVDDCPDNRASLAMLLLGWGYEARCVTDRQPFLQAFPASRPHAVFLDLGLPRLDGWEVALQIRGQEEGPAVLLIALTGHGRHEDRERPRLAGI